MPSVRDHCCFGLVIEIKCISPAAQSCSCAISSFFLLLLCRDCEDLSDRNRGSSVFTDFHGLVHHQQHQTGDDPSTATLTCQLLEQTCDSWKYLSLHLCIWHLSPPTLNEDPEWRKRNPIPGRVDVHRDYQIFLLHIQPASPPPVLHQMGQVEKPGWAWVVFAVLQLITWARCRWYGDFTPGLIPTLALH